jgi:hypothetical protein
MTLSRKDAEATVLTGLVVLIYLASRLEWNVPLVGSSHRWAAAAILVVGMSTCAVGAVTSSIDADPVIGLFGLVGAVALGAAIWVFAAGSLTALTVLVVADVLLWLGSTIRHSLPEERGRRLAT